MNTLLKFIAFQPNFPKKFSLHLSSSLFFIPFYNLEMMQDYRSQFRVTLMVDYLRLLFDM